MAHTKGPATTRWQLERTEDERHTYAARFAELAAEGADLHGEARFVDALLAPSATVLDAGCGTARVGAELALRGHLVVAVDADEVLVAAAPAQPGLTVAHADLTELDLRRRFDAVVVAGNVMVFLAAGTERAVLGRLREHLGDDGALVTGFATDRAYTVADFDVDVDANGLRVEHRFSTWDLRPWRTGSDWAVSVIRAH